MWVFMLQVSCKEVTLDRMEPAVGVVVVSGLSLLPGRLKGNIGILGNEIIAEDIGCRGCICRRRHASPRIGLGLSRISSV